MSKLEHTVQHAVMTEFGVGRNFRIWRNNVGMAVTESGRRIRYGVPGSPDICGILRVSHVCENCFHTQPERGLWFGIETKREVGGETAENQLAFHAMARQYGGLVAVVNSVEEARVYMKQWGAQWRNQNL